MSSRDFRLLSHEAMDFIRTKIAVNLFKICICDHNDIDQNDDTVILVNQISDMSADESDEELENYGGDDEAGEEASSMIVTDCQFQLVHAVKYEIQWRTLENLWNST